MRPHFDYLASVLTSSSAAAQALVSLFFYTMTFDAHLSLSLPLPGYLPVADRDRSATVFAQSLHLPQ